MTPGEPLEKTKDAENDRTDAILLGPSTRGAEDERNAMLADTADLLSQTLDGIGPEDDDDAEDMASLDEEVRSLLNTIAEEESQHDEAWVEVSQREETGGGERLAAPDPDPVDSDDAEPELPVPGPGQAEPESVISEPAEPEPVAALRHKRAVLAPADTLDAVEAEEPHDTAADVAPARTAPDTSQMQAIDALGQRFEAAETRNGEALDRIGHALGMIATRIDGLESRATDRTIADVAFVAAPPEEEDEDDASVAPYIARAEREIKAKKESGSMDIFDRIARAAETKFDDETGSSESRIVANSGDGRRVGTKRWQPSRAVKKRMELLEKARTESMGDEGPAVERPAPASRRLHVEDEEVPAKRAAPVEEPMAPTREPEAESEAELGSAPGIEVPEDDDAGLSVLPGARGRRRNRARKSALDSDFENVFAEEGDKPSIQSLRRKMRERPVEAPEENTKKGGMLGGLLGRKPARKDAVEPALSDPAIGHEQDQDQDQDDDLMAAFDAADEAPAIDAPEKPAKPKKAAKSRKVEPVDLDEDDDDLDEDWDEDDAASGSRRKPLIYALIAAAAAAGFAVWKMFLA